MIEVRDAEAGGEGERGLRVNGDGGVERVRFREAEARESFLVEPADIAGEDRTLAGSGVREQVWAGEVVESFRGVVAEDAHDADRIASQVPVPGTGTQPSKQKCGHPGGSRHPHVDMAKLCD